MATTQRERNAAQSIQDGMDTLARRRAFPIFG
jgi:hypothetical protein